MARSINIDVNFFNKFSSNLQILTQLKGNRFQGKCREEQMEGEEKYIDQLGSVTAQVRDPAVAQFPASPTNVIEHKRRQVTATAYDVGLFVDKIDKVQTMVEPESEYAMQMVTALNRKRDIEFFKGALGDAATGKAGAGTAAFTDCPVVDVNAEGMTLDKLLNALFALEQSGVDVEDPNDQPYMVWTPRQKNELLTSTKTTSSDYAAVKALVSGQIDSFYGFKFITSNLVPFANTAGTGVTFAGAWDATEGNQDKPLDYDTTGVRGCFAYTKKNIIQATNPDIMTRATERSDRSYDWYTYALIRTGAVRLEENKTVFVPCDESGSISFPS